MSDPFELLERPLPHATTDWLALERTELANERTMLAWLRTGLGFGAAGATLLHIGAENPTEVAVGAAAVGLAGALVAAGVVRYARAAARHRRWRDRWAEAGISQPEPPSRGP